MKHLMIIFLASIGFAFGQDFREVNWGATRAEVRASETFTELGEDGDSIYFTGIVSGLDVAAVYRFLPDGQLYIGYYVFDEEYTNENQHITDYENIKGILTRVYGAPDNDEIVWDDDLYRDDPSSYGLAVSIGHVLYRSTYTTETTFVGHVLSGNNYETSHLVQYESLELSDEAQQQEQGAEDDAF